MTQSPETIEVYLEIGKKRTFAGALDWPGWCRPGRDESSALQTLSNYVPRYAQALRQAQIDLPANVDESAFAVVEQLEGNASTDFGAPAIPPSGDTQPVNNSELLRFQAMLQAFWQTFDTAVQTADGKHLRKGPRGGGRDLEAIVQHLLDADASYLSRLAWNLKKDKAENLDQQLTRTRQAILDALEAAAHGELPERGPRGGKIWKPRYFIRRVAWHVLDHTWEIEDRIIQIEET